MSVGRFPFWRVVPGQRSGEYVLPVMPPATAGPDGAPHIMGGVALGAIVDAMELASELPLLWAQVQFLGPTQHAEELAIEVEQCGGGQAVAQFAASASVNGRPTHRASGALGEREPNEQTLFSEMPEVKGPDESLKVEISHSAPGGLPDQFDYRIAHQDEERGVQAIWTRSHADFAVDAGWLAIISDLFLGAHPATRGGSSLDAMFRFVQAAEPGWVLSYTELAAFDRGVVHGSARHFAKDGRLLAISSQTGVLPRIPRVP
ncbi:acyl-CoA thioesterase domain-containing protein [Qipengyuania flava]|uniref:acyl-CoA thioesterase domain-containing protein n=1 Tax=Qipengyuania flava TaxID=192812 RepID=UPI001C627A32|nr:acyl-CoA thioesterase domain-containing protein [Qipengyuania flava]QYJ07580.1 thioesterase family protein [Qipengyuania flava]